MADRIVTPAEKLACIRRELSMRLRVYPRWIDNGKMTAAKANDEIAVMRAIEADYLAKVEGARLL